MLVDGASEQKDRCNSVSTPTHSRLRLVRHHARSGDCKRDEERIAYRGAPRHSLYVHHEEKKHREGTWHVH